MSVLNSTLDRQVTVARRMRASRTDRFRWFACGRDWPRPATTADGSSQLEDVATPVEHVIAGGFADTTVTCGGTKPAGSHARYVERFIGSVRRECLDHVIALTAAGLRRILREYVAYYSRTRTHLGLNKDAPLPRPVAPRTAGPVIAIPQVGGLHHRYERRAA
jgi:Integrase core domain